MAKQHPSSPSKVLSVKPTLEAMNHKEELTKAQLQGKHLFWMTYSCVLQKSIQYSYKKQAYILKKFFKIEMMFIWNMDSYLKQRQLKVVLRQ